jgi:simple sugar transport system substrate-binding protein
LAQFLLCFQSTRFKEVSMTKRVLTCSIILVLLLCSAFFLVAEGQGEHKSAGEKYRFVLVSHGGAGDVFWENVYAGMEDAAKLLGVEAVMQYSKGDYGKQVDFIEAAIAAKVSGIGVVISTDDAFDQPIAKALAAGIPAIAFNVDDSQGAAGNPRLAFIGQDFTVAGYALGKLMAAKLKRGDHVACPVESPGQVYAQQRYAGVKRALDEKGITSEMVDAGYETLSVTLTRVAAYLQGHPETDAVISLGSMPNEMAPKAIAELGLTGKVITGGFDISEGIYRDIKDGRTLYGVDQQPYSQGFLTVVMLYLAAAKGQTPMDVNTGSAIISKDNIQRYAKFYE